MRQHAHVLLLTTLTLLGGTLTVHAQGVISGNEFNPAISLILDGQYSSYSNDAEDYEISGFPLDEEAGLTAEGFSLDESELNISANVDDQFYGYADIVFTDTEGETEVELEEAWFETLALPAGFVVKGGKFLSGIGYHNAFHPHSWDFSDEPLAYRAMLGKAFTDVGVQGRWVAPTDLFLTFGGEAFRGDSYPAQGSANDGTGAFSLFAKAGGDLGASHSWKAGLSWLSYDVEDAGLEAQDGDLLLNGDGDLYVAEFVWKWAPNGNARERNFKLQAEYLHREEDGDADFEGLSGNQSGGYDTDQDGVYVQGVYQFMPRWRVGLRYDWLSADNRTPGITAATPFDGDDREPDRYTFMVDFSNSEFSRLRLQVSEDNSSADSDTQVVLQYVLSIGAHGAHAF
ncbi:MAG: TonB-dependent receptor [Gammaproteobacteria bacterium]|nr:MAG: TonB-dependent receptor [Gammaproteobacteria bacterium]